MLDINFRKVGKYVSTSVKIENTTHDLGLLDEEDLDNLATSVGSALEDVCAILNRDAGSFVDSSYMENIIFKAYKAGVRSIAEEVYKPEVVESVLESIYESEAMRNFKEE